MAYTNNVPQGNQQIATTQPIIQANFGFIQTSIGTEHNFNPAGSGSDTYHLQASMPNKADPGALPAGTNGQFYVGAGLPKFYDGTTASFLQTTSTPFKILTGTINLTTSPQTVATVPQNTCGQYWMIPNASQGSQNASAMGFYVSSQTTIEVGAVDDPGILFGSSGLNLRAAVNSSTYAGSFKYIVVYFTP